MTNNAAPKSKTAQIREAWAAGDKIGALRIASKFTDQSGDTKAMQRGWDAHNNPDFYKQVGKNPVELTEKALAVIERKFITPKAKKNAAKVKPAEKAAAKAEPAPAPAASDNSGKRKAALKIAARATPKPKKPEKPARPEKPEKPEAPEKPTKPLGKRAAILEAAQRGELPPVPDFSAPTHARFRKKLDEVVEMAKAGDLKGLKAFQINPVSTSPKAIARYRDLAVIAIEARATQGKAA